MLENRYIRYIIILMIAFGYERYKIKRKRDEIKEKEKVDLKDEILVKIYIVDRIMELSLAVVVTMIGVLHGLLS